MPPWTASPFNLYNFFRLSYTTVIVQLPLKCGDFVSICKRLMPDSRVLMYLLWKLWLSKTYALKAVNPDAERCTEYISLRLDSLLSMQLRCIPRLRIHLNIGSGKLFVVYLHLVRFELRIYFFQLWTIFKTFLTTRSYFVFNKEFLLKIKFAKRSSLGYNISLDATKVLVFESSYSAYDGTFINVAKLTCATELWWVFERGS